MKKSWNKPELTVLVRTRPEEAVLGLCKNTTVKTGAAGAQNQCLQIDDGYGGCNTFCQTQPDS